jgi:hypothetical protein
MKNLPLLEKIHSLPARQQISLWIILKNFRNKKGVVSFTVNDFCDEAKKYFVSKDPESIGKIAGGVLSSLVRNEMIIKISGGREKIWSVVDELNKNAKKYESEIFPIVSYWEK